MQKGFAASWFAVPAQLCRISDTVFTRLAGAGPSILRLLNLMAGIRCVLWI
jgi:hypothetical protein